MEHAGQGGLRGRKPGPAAQCSRAMCPTSWQLYVYFYN